jgi:hypothetical protein
MSQSDTPTDNPAGRLHALLAQLSQVDQGQGQPAASVFFQAMNVTDWPDFYRVLAKILTLIEETEFKIQSLGPRKEGIYRKSLVEIRAHLCVTDWCQAWANIAIPFHDPESSLLNSLALCALDLAGKDNLIDSHDLDNLRKSVDDLIQDILSAEELPPELKFFLLEKLREIQRAIDNYTFFGSEGLRKTIESIFGATYISQDQEIRDGKSPMIKQFWEIIKNASTLLSLISNFEKITPVIQNVVPAILEAASK